MSTTILGANGRLGSMIARVAQTTGAHWRTQSRKGPADVIWDGDFSRAGDLFIKGSTVINMIGETGQNTTLLHALNVQFVADLLQHAKRAGVAHVMLASSAAVYGAGDGTPFAETDTPAPLNAYGISKVEMEKVAAHFKDGPAITVLRIGNVAGADALTAAAKDHIPRGKPMPLHHFEDEQTPVRSYIGPRDLFRAIRDLSAAHDDGLRTVNIAHPEPVSFKALLTAYKEHVLPDLGWVNAPAPETTPRTVTLDTTKLRKVTNFMTHPDTAGALAHQVAEVANT